jgi:hypothetical protein
MNAAAFGPLSGNCQELIILNIFCKLRLTM